MARNNTAVFERPDSGSRAETHDSRLLRVPLSEGEEELISELVHALRSIRYGSIAITLHDGRIVEIQRTERIRTNGSKATLSSTYGGCKD